MANGLTAAQFYSTASYKNGELGEIDLSNNNLDGWSLSEKNLLDTNFSNSVISNADFSVTTDKGFTKEQLYSTSSYVNKDLHGIKLGDSDLSGWGFSGKNLQNASFEYAYLKDVVLDSVDLRGANMENTTGVYITKNTIMTDGKIQNFSMASSADNFSIRKYTPATEGGVTISAKFASDSAVSGDATLTLEQGAEVEVIDTAVLSFDAESTLAINTNVDGISTFTIGDNAGLIFEDGATLNINLEGTVDVDTPYTFSALNWSETSTINGIENLIKDSTLFLSINGSLLTGNWESLVKDNGLFISMNAVPEPATYAAIFGALALALAVARRRR